MRDAELTEGSVEGRTELRDDGAAERASVDASKVAAESHDAERTELVESTVS